MWSEIKSFECSELKPISNLLYYIQPLENTAHNRFASDVNPTTIELANGSAVHEPCLFIAGQVEPMHYASRAYNALTPRSSLHGRCCYRC